MSQDNTAYRISEYALNKPDKIAVMDFYGPGESVRRTPFVELEKSIMAIHCFMEFHGVGQGSFVAVMSQSCCEVLEVFLAAFRLGATPYLIPSEASDTDVEHILESIPPDVIFFEQEHLNIVKHSANVDLKPLLVMFNVAVNIWHVEDLETSLDSYARLKSSAWNEPSEKYEGTPQYIVFSSDSMGCQRAILREFKGGDSEHSDVSGISLSCHGDSPLILATSLPHAIDDALNSLQQGRPVAMSENFEAQEYLKMVISYQPSCLWLQPFQIVDCSRYKSDFQGVFGSVKLIAVYGEYCDETIMQQARELFDCPIISCYGLKEGDPKFSFNHLPLHGLPSNCVGKAPVNNTVKLIDLKGQESSAGELYFKNDSLFSEYYDDDELTSQKVLDGWFATGDIFSQDSAGLFYYQGSAADAFVFGGESIYPQNIEAVLLSHPSIEMACVVSLSDQKNSVIPVAMITLNRESKMLSLGDITDYFFENGRGEWAPRWILVADTLPLFDSGKVNRREVKLALRKSGHGESS